MVLAIRKRQRLCSSEKMVLVTRKRDNMYRKSTDDIERMILNDGYIPNTHLHRQWTTTQTIRHSQGILSDGKSDFDEYFIQKKPYKYSWQTVLSEIKTLRHIQESKALSEKEKQREISDKTRFINKNVIIEMMQDYAKDLDTKINNIVQSRKPMYNKYIINDNTICIKLNQYDGYIVMTDDLTYDCNLLKQSGLKVITYDSLKVKLNSCIENIKKAKSYRRLEKIIENFMKECPVSVKLEKSKAWINAFVGTAAYCTINNMIKFHNCFIYDKNNKPMSQYDSLNELEKRTDAYKNEFHKLYEFMEKFIADNKDKIRETV